MSQSTFDIVKLVYPNDWRKNISELGISPGIFNWSICSKRIYDSDLDLFYIEVSPNVQFYCEQTGETLVARGIKKETDDIDKPEIQRARLLILSDPHNKKVLCNKYQILCGCSSPKDVLSTECDLVLNKNLMFKTAKKALELGYDGAVVKHECMQKYLECAENPVCQNAVFLFKKNANGREGGYNIFFGEKNERILEPIEGDYIERCSIIQYAKKNNRCIKNTIKNFPSIEKINADLKNKSCQEVSREIYNLLNTYMVQKSLQ